MVSMFTLFYNNETIVIQCYKKNKHIILFLINKTFNHKKTVCQELSMCELLQQQDNNNNKIHSKR